MDPRAGLFRLGFDIIEHCLEFGSAIDGRMLRQDLGEIGFECGGTITREPKHLAGCFDHLFLGHALFIRHAPTRARGRVLCQPILLVDGDALKSR